ncbi:hypothetical protein IEQ34_013331 [Dendrobium chrysotoxum]|uniref:Ferritin n=1 Tax=Dendrobium chrysotoxum TaxID=161865 RepID=A0AAV7GPG3_DENCH|nr:hypothetical protein IEQ34_013331 [Dendrobium chrysotoxum]
MLLRASSAVSLISSSSESSSPGAFLRRRSQAMAGFLTVPQVGRSAAGPIAAGGVESSRALTGVLFEPFEEVKQELALVTSSPGKSLARQKYADESEAAINEQINIEYNVSYVYHAMFAYFDRDNVALRGMAKFFKESSEEERDHAEKLMKYQNKRGGRVKLQSILMPLTEFDHEEKGDALYAMELALSLERLVNEKLLNLHSVAARSNDPNMTEFIESHFLAEQVEAIKKISEYVAQLRMVGKGHGVWHFDQFSLSLFVKMLLQATSARSLIFSSSQASSPATFLRRRPPMAGVLRIPMAERSEGRVVAATGYDRSGALTGFLFEPFVEVQHELALVPSSPDKSLARQKYVDECEAAINEQINVEYNVSYVYHALFAYFDRDNVALRGIAKFFKESSEEEREHAEKLMKYQNKRGGRVKLQSILLPLTEFNHEEKGDALYAMELALSLERLVNEKLLNTHSVAARWNDPHTTEFIEREFLEEQVEAIKKISEYVAQLRRVGKGHGVWHFDQILLHEGENGAA